MRVTDRHKAVNRGTSAVGRVGCALALLLCVAFPQARADGGGPVLDHDFPDPDVVRVGATYHAYATNGDGHNIRHATSRDLVRWELDADDVLPALGGWAALEQRGKVWAPEVYDNGDGFTMHYTARDEASGRQCVGVAVADSADGPFTPVGDRPLVCPDTEGGAIDASSHTEGDQRYILWKNDGNCCSRPTWIHLQPTSWDGTRVTGPPVRLITRDLDWEGGLVEAPTLVKRAGRYVLLYSADAYDGEGYKIGYAVADRLDGPYTKAATPLVTTESVRRTVIGPGGQDVVTGPDGRDHLLFHGWRPLGERRVMYRADLGFADGGHPVVRGSKVRHQAERAVVHHALVRDAERAQDGRAVGHIDHADSHVEFRVFAASGGRHTLTVRFGNGSLDPSGAPSPASHTLTVNGRAAGDVRYPHTGWDQWSTVEAPLDLRAGWNTVRLSKGDLYAELDSVEVD